MKKNISVIFVIILLSLCAWTSPKNTHFLNSNTWCIQIGGKDLITWTKNEMGDEVKLKLKSLKSTDILHVQRYLCGQTSENSITTLTIKNNFNKIIKEVTHKSSSMMFEADIPLKDFINQFWNGQTISIYFTINSNTKALSDTVLLGRLKLE